MVMRVSSVTGPVFEGMIDDEAETAALAVVTYGSRGWSGGDASRMRLRKRAWVVELWKKCWAAMREAM